jgi:hypothetical protein
LSENDIEKEIDIIKLKEQRLKDMKQTIENFNVNRQKEAFVKVMDLVESFQIVNEARNTFIVLRTRLDAEKLKLKPRIEKEIERLRIEEEEDEKQEEEEEDEIRRQDRNYIRHLRYKLSVAYEEEEGTPMNCPNCRVETKFRPNAVGKMCCNQCGFILGVTRSE